MQATVNVMANASTTPDRFARSDRFSRCMSFLSVHIAGPATDRVRKLPSA
jgi:hypothetical protein